MCSPNEALLGLKKCYKIEGSEKLEELSSIQNRVEELRLQDKLGNQNFVRILENYTNHWLTQVKILLEL